ncbi:MAG: DNA polymerase I [Oscillospiraceae bacterium]|nr:DNA polymerase I [Oscillospiraceae bacterium]
MKLLAIDSNSILNRAFYGIKLLSTPEGVYTNALVGFLNILHKLTTDIQPDAIAFAFDLKGPTFRHQMYDGYKAQRKGMPEELAQQLPRIKEILTLMGYPILEVQGYEGDDILGTLAAHCGREDRCIIATGDRDSLQLVRDNVTVLLATTKAGGAMYTAMTPDAIMDQYGVAPRQLIDVKALMGDSSDNIPGVAGIGEKTALSLIINNQTLDTIYNNLETIQVTPSVRAKLQKGRESAYMSRDLARIRCDVPLPMTMEELAPKPMREGELYDLLASLHMMKHIEKLGLRPGNSARLHQLQAEAPVYALAAGGELPAWGEKPLCIAAEYEEERITQLAVACEKTVTLWNDPDQALVEAICALPGEKYTEDCKALFRAVLPAKLENVTFDTRLAGYLLAPDANDYTVPRLAEECALPTPVVEGEEVPEVAVRAALLAGLCPKMKQRLEENDQLKLLGEIEIPLAQVLADMERLGFAIDCEALTAFGQELDVEIERLQTAIYLAAGGEFNINSPKQLGEVLFERLGLPARKKTKNGYSTNAEVLESLSSYHPIVENVLEYRKYTKLRSTYVEGLGKAIGPDGRIHSVFNQTETRTGRISSAEPNLQNIPVRTELGAKMREFFHARPGWVLVDADYSQIELRVLAAIANDDKMLEAFAAGQDIHTNTAAQVFGMPVEFVTPLMRTQAKAVNFGIVYGIGAFSLSKDIGVSVSEADRYIKNYLKTYEGVGRYMEKTVADAKECGYITTLFGRRRYLPELKSSNFNLRSFGERVAMNAPIQGTAADIIKIAMIRVFERLKREELEAQLILQVHDELIVEAPESEAAHVAEILREEMEGAAQLKVKLEADTGIGKTWGEAH